jgi:hypothetical protein
MVFSVIIQSCLPPRLRPPINNPSTVKLPLSIRGTPTTQCCLPGVISSLLAPSLPPCYLLVLRCLLLYVLAIICHVVTIFPPTKTQDKTDSPYHPSNADNDGADDDNAADNADDDDADNNAENTAATQTRTTIQLQTTPLGCRQWTTMQPKTPRCQRRTTML